MKLFDTQATIDDGHHLLDKKTDKLLFIISVASLMAAAFFIVLVSQMG